MSERKDIGQVAPSAGMGIADIYYILFRHKWKIICFSVLGVAAGVFIYVSKPALYTSAAKLYVRYVRESRMPSGGAGNDVIHDPDSQGQNIINSEIEIITSLDISKAVVDEIGAERILAKYGGGNSRNAAAGLIKKDIAIDVPKHSDVVKIIYQHKDRELVQPILAKLIESYLKFQSKIRSDQGLSESFLTNRIVSLQGQLSETERALKDAKAKAGVSELADAKKANGDRIASLSADILNTKADLAQHEATLKELTKLSPASAPGTNAEQEIPADARRDYKNVTARLERLYAQDQELSAQLTTNTPPVIAIRQQIAEAEQLKQNLESKYPRLAIVAVVSPATNGSQQSRVTLDPTAESIAIQGLRSRVEFLSTQLDQAKAEKARIEEMEPAIVQLQRDRELLEKEVRESSSSLDAARFKEMLDASKISSISIAQSPSPPYRDLGPLQKLLMMAIAGGTFGGIALAFIIELFLDPTIKRPVEVEGRLHLPLLLTIPDVHQKGFRLPGGRRNGHTKLQAPEPGSGHESPPDEHGKFAVALRDSGDPRLRLFLEGLRHRLFIYFETNELTHNPKLVAVTACREGAGVTTIAAGLAATLSETGEGNVLLVDMTNGQESAHAFHKGQPACGLEEALESPKKDGAMVQENLYVVAGTGNGDKLANARSLEIAQLVPKLKASDYDYIIFDMPPVSQISVSSKMARLMDINLLVVESERTNREIVKQASVMLAGTKNNLGVVLNKKRTYVPGWLVQEL